MPVRFTITLSVPTVHLTGLEALDFCRRYGLDDSTQIQLSSSGHNAARTLQCDVSEAFARRWFSSSQLSKGVTVLPEFLAPGDIEYISDKQHVCTLSATMSAIRMMELFETVEIDALKDSIEDAEREHAENMERIKELETRIAALEAKR